MFSQRVLWCLLTREPAGHVFLFDEKTASLKTTTATATAMSLQWRMTSERLVSGDRVGVGGMAGATQVALVG